MGDQKTKFINSLFLKNLLENKYQQTDVNVKKYTVDAGKHLHKLVIRFASQECKENILFLVVKVMPTDTQFLSIFNTEISIYNVILPRYDDLLRKCDSNVRFAPAVIMKVGDPIDGIILEDIKSQGYSAEEPNRGLTIEQSQLAIEKLAIFHATSVVHRQKNVADYANYNFGTLTASNVNAKKYFTDSLNAFVSNAAAINIPGSFIKKITTLLPQLLQKSIDDYSSSFNGFDVLNHGNLWSKNILFKYNNEKPIDVLFIDFENTYIGSPIIDLMYFFTSSVAFNVIGDYKNELLYIYHSKLTDILGRLGYKGYVPTLLEFQVEFLKRGILELTFTLTTAPYLRTRNCPIHPAIYPPFEQVPVDLNAASLEILQAHAEDIIEQLTTIEYNGLLDSGVQDSKIRTLFTQLSMNAAS